MKKLLALSALAFTLLQGCVASMVMNSQDRDHYGQYQVEMAKINMEREKSGMKPEPVQTFEEWKTGGKK